MWQSQASGGTVKPGRSASMVQSFILPAFWGSRVICQTVSDVRSAGQLMPAPRSFIGTDESFRRNSWRPGGTSGRLGRRSAMPKTGPGEDAIQIAHRLIRSYGLRAAAVAQEHLSELQVQADTTDLEKWRQVQL